MNTQLLLAPPPRDIWYVYVKSRPNGRPFYVGKGRNNRHLSTAGRTKQYLNIIKKHGLENIITSFVCFSADEKTVFAFEKKFISLFRLAGHDLANIAAGGEGNILTPELNKLRSEVLRKTLSTAEAREKKSRVMREVYNRPGYRERARLKAKETNSRPEVKEKISQALKKHWQDPAVREKQTISNRATRNDPIVRFNHSIAMLLKWADPSYKEKVTLKIRAQLNRPEYLIAKAEEARAKWLDPEYRAKVYAGTKGKKRDPSVGKKISDSLKVSEKYRAYQLRKTKGE